MVRYHFNPNCNEIGEFLRPQAHNNRLPLKAVRDPENSKTEQFLNKNER